MGRKSLWLILKITDHIEFHRSVALERSDCFDGNTHNRNYAHAKQLRAYAFRKVLQDMPSIKCIGAQSCSNYPLLDYISRRIHYRTISEQEDGV